MAIPYALEDVEVDEIDILDTELAVGDREGCSYKLTLSGAGRMFGGLGAAIPGFGRAAIYPSPPISITARTA